MALEVRRVRILLLWITVTQARVVPTKYGSIRGIVTSSGVQQFLGVPYASAPLGSLRFMPPVTPPHWRGVRPAENFGPACPQTPPDVSNVTEALRRMPRGRVESLRRLVPFLRNQSEDCLYLNVYVPPTGRESGTKMAVIMFVHGESYAWNSGNPYDGSVLASFGTVIVVTLNFRLGILGWLPPMEGATRGNYGLLDQVAALHWIQENVAQFGGDPHNVTVFGCGHGAAQAHLLMMSPMARGLFHRAILQSGSAFSPWAIARDSYSYIRKLARVLGCSSETVLVECLRVIPVHDLLRVEMLVPDHLTVFGPTVDGVVIPSDPLVEPHPDTEGNYKYDVLFGVDRVESYFEFSAHEERYGLEPDKRDRMVRTLVRNLFSFHLQDIFLTIVNEYTDWTRPVQHPINVLDGLIDAFGDALVVSPLIKAYTNPPARAYFYVFSYQTEGGPFPQRLGCIPGEELPYMFGAPLVGNLGQYSRNFSRSEVALSEAVMTYWTNFAKVGDPNYLGHELETEKTRGRFERILWPPYDNVHQKYLMIGMKPKVRDHYHAHRLSIWLHLIPKLHRPGGSSQHHLLEDHDNALTYEGIVRPFPPLFSVSSPTHGMSSTQRNESLDAVLIMPTPYVTTPSPNLTDSLAVVLRHNGYSTALSVTIAVGCSLLVLNVLIFAGVYYQRDKHRLQMKLHKRSYKMQQMDSSASQGMTKQTPLEPPSSLDQQLPLGFSPPPPVMDISLGAPKIPPKPILLPPLPEAQPLLSHGVVVKPVPSEMRGPNSYTMWTGENVITV